MTSFIKPGKVVILLSGRHAGQKAVIIKCFADGTRERKFGHVLVCGIERPPKPVKKSMSKKKITKRSRIKSFTKFVNYVHIMPTRYNVSEKNLAQLVSVEAMKQSESKVAMNKNINKELQKKYLNRGKNTPGQRFLYSKLRF